MKTTLTLILVALIGASNAVAQQSGESFEQFLSQFASDAAFRVSRTSDPLPVQIGSELVSEVLKEKWPASRVAAKTAPLLSKQGLSAQGLQQRITKLGAREIEVFQYREEADSYMITYRFELRNGKWYLAAYLDESM